MEIMLLSATTPNSQSHMMNKKKMLEPSRRSLKHLTLKMVIFKGWRSNICEQF